MNSHLSPCGLVLAGGQSSRMGQNKARMLWNGVPMFQYMAGLLEQAGVHPVMVSGSGYGEASVPDLITGRGPLGGIHACLQTLKDGERLLIVPVDMPLLPVEALQILSEQHQPCCFDNFTLPMLLPVMPLLREWVEFSIHSTERRDYSLWRLHKNLQGITLKLPDPMVSAFSNANTPQDWQWCQQQLSEKYFDPAKQGVIQTMAHNHFSEFVPLNIAVLTVSDTRTEENDTSGHLLVESLQAESHKLADKAIVKDDIYKIREVLSRWIASDAGTPECVQAVLITGGTGFSGRDSTPEAVLPLFDKQIDGYGELFRQLSFEQIKTSTIQSRTVAGMANGTVIFVMPGSNNACKTAWEGIIRDQLHSLHRPCNFVEHLKQAG